MRTTLNLNDELVREVMKATKARTKTEAITQAMTDLIRRTKLERLKALSGKIRLNADWRRSEEAELRRQRHVKRRWHGHR